MAEDGYILTSLQQPELVGVHALQGFTPRIVDQTYLSELGVNISPTEECLALLHQGSVDFGGRFTSATLAPPHTVEVTEAGDSYEFTIHDYTGRCPRNTFEINPVTESCGIGCLYCLVCDGDLAAPMAVYSDYHEQVANLLQRGNGAPRYYYFSPKTEAFQEATLVSGIAHNILRKFIRHFADMPDSKATLFIASKAGSEHLTYSHGGDTILDLLATMASRVQFNTSIGIMPDYLYGILEPFAPPVAERLAAVRLCQQVGVMASSVLAQPTFIPLLTESLADEFFRQMSAHGIINYKPEFLTVSPCNLAFIGQVIGHFDRDAERRLYELYLAPDNEGHKKQRHRTAPDRQASIGNVAMLQRLASSYGISMSICYWVREQLGITEEDVPFVNANGYQCLGYQAGLLN